MFPKSSSIRPIWNSVAKSFGGVAVLVVLLVAAVSGDDGRCGACAGDFENLPPKENVRPAARNALERGGTAIS